MIRIFLALPLLFCIVPHQLDAEDFIAGVRSYDGGHYAGVFGYWRALAESGDVRARVAITDMYRFSEG